MSTAPSNTLSPWRERPVPEAGPALVSAPAVERRLPTGQVHASERVTGGTWLLGAHGGAGVTSLLRAGSGGHDAVRAWPRDGLVVLVARRTAYGLEWARDAARQYASGCAPAGVALAGLVVVADAPGRAPARVQNFLDLISAAFPRLWEVPWVEQWRLAGYAEPLPTPPAVRQLSNDLQALRGASTSYETE